MELFKQLSSGSIADIKVTDNLYLESDGGRNLSLWVINDMEEFLLYFRITYGSPPVLRKIILDS